MATETDAGAWTLTHGAPEEALVYTYQGGSGLFALEPGPVSQLLAAGGSYTLDPTGSYIASITIPTSLLNQVMTPRDSRLPGDATWLWLAHDLTYFNYAQTASNGDTIRYTTAYDANIVSQAGHTVLAKGMNINTGNKVAATQSNLKADTLVTYVATGEGGNIVGSEDLLIDGSGNTTSASDRMLCPFSTTNGNVIPAYCNIVQAGSQFDLTAGTVRTGADDRFVGTDATIPVALDYNIDVSPYGTTGGSIPAMGSTSAYLKAHDQEARSPNTISITEWEINSDFYTYHLLGTPLKAEDLQYSETSSASGTIQQFTKVIHYQSGKTLMP